MFHDLWYLKSLANWQFVQQLVQTNKKSKLCITGSLSGESMGNWWMPFKKVLGKCCHVVTPSWLYDRSSWGHWTHYQWAHRRCGFTFGYAVLKLNSGIIIWSPWVNPMWPCCLWGQVNKGSGNVVDKRSSTRKDFNHHMISVEKRSKVQIYMYVFSNKLSMARVSMPFMCWKDASISHLLWIHMSNVRSDTCILCCIVWIRCVSLESSEHSESCMPRKIRLW